MFAWALSPACRRMGSSPTLPGEDEAYPVSVVLAVLAQPAQEFVDILFSPRRDAVVVILEHPVDEDRKLVDCEHHRPLILRQGRADRVALLLPASAVDPGPAASRAPRKRPANRLDRRPHAGHWRIRT